MAISAMQAAKLACSASGWELTNLQLQKILYIAHMLYAGRHEGNPLVGDETFEAWGYGPVLPSVYRHVSAFGNRPIKNVFHRVESVPMDTDEYKMITDAVDRLCRMSPFRLVEITHEPGSAWHRNYFPGVMGVDIPQADVVAEYHHRFPDAATA